MAARPVVLTSPQCGGTHAVIGLLKGLGLQLAGRHGDGIWYDRDDRGLRGKINKRQNGTRLTEDFDVPISAGQFATGHSGPFPTRALVICNLRDPRNIAICHWKRRRRAGQYDFSFREWLHNGLAENWAKGIPRHWSWAPGTDVLRVWHEDIMDEKNQRHIAEFCGVPWKRTDFYGRGKTWSGDPSNWQNRFDGDCATAWDRLWQTLTAQPWDEWWQKNGPGYNGTSMRSSP